MRSQSERWCRKTTTAVNLAAGLAKAGQRTLLIDLDPQCNATSGLVSSLQPTIPCCWTMVCGKASWKPVSPIYLSCQAVAALSTSIGSNAVNPAMPIRSSSIGSRDGRVRFRTDRLPTFAGQLTQAALAASTEVLMPIQCEFYAMEGLTQMIQVIRQVMQSGTGRLAFGGSC